MLNSSYMKYVYEFIGTFFLVLVVGMTVLAPSSVGIMAPVAIGSILAVMIYAGAHLSGAHYNPAVSLAIFMLRRKFDLRGMLIYWVVQFAAGALAAWLAVYLKGSPRGATPIEMDMIKALIAEFLFTFALCFVVLNVAMTKINVGNSFYGFAIGFVVLAGAFAVGSISGAAFNPAVALGITIMNLSFWSNLWIFIVANFLGAAAAALIFNAAYKGE
jgi:aquaporin Z